MSKQLPNIVYKIVSKTNWNNFIRSGMRECKGFDNDIRDGFIHLSTHEQLYPTFIKKYKLVDKSKFNLLGVDLGCSKDVRWEKANNGQIYPHLYSNLIIGENVIWVYGMENYQFDANGL